jgi:hypothetical protein
MQALSQLLPRVTSSQTAAPWQLWCRYVPVENKALNPLRFGGWGGCWIAKHGRFYFVFYRRGVSHILSCKTSVDVRMQVACDV